ncbi:heavy-metal-associated domain-containing protein [Thalassospira sp. MIT1370]|uniref:heavy-metal-associated domain-containing protein n=1 Tax=unclassified Thalassospira TaxID=2648997 RepID=UPI003999A352
MDTTTFKIDGMHCDGCAERIRSLLNKEPGVREARVAFATGSAEVRYNPHTVDGMRLREIIETGGFDVVETTG